MKQTAIMTKAVAAAADYTAKDVISNSATAGTAWEFQLAPGVKRIIGARLLVKTASQAHVCTLLLFKSDPAKWTTPPNLHDNVANTAPVWAHIDQALRAIEFMALKSLGGCSFAVATPGTYGNLPIEVETDDIFKVYGVLITETAFTNETAGDEYRIELDYE